jgi:hypothetical protein
VKAHSFLASSTRKQAELLPRYTSFETQHALSSATANHVLVPGWR